jgi:hypothetical protein
MTSWMRPTAAVIAGRPVVLVALIVTVCTWCAAAEIYWVALQGPHHGESAAAVLVGVDVLYSWLLVAGFLALVKDLKELRIPQLRSLLIISLLAVFVMVFLAPCVAVWLLGGPAGDVVFMAMGSVVGTAGPAVCQSGYRVRNARVAARNAGPARLMTDSVRAPRPQAWRAVRVAFGAPYAPESWTRRVIELALWCAVLAAAPLLVWSFESSLNPRGFRILLHVAELVSIVIAIASCWLWPLARVVTLVTSQSGTLTELALLPGQGSGRQQLRRLCLVALSIPSAALIVVLGLALGVVKLEHLPQAMYARVAAEFLLIPLLTLPALAGRLTKPPGPNAWAGAMVMFSQTWTWLLIFWTTTPETWHGAPPIFFWAAIAIIAVGLMFLIGMTINALRKLLRRPHPYMDVS